MEIAYLKINGRETGEEEYLAATGEKLTLSWKCSGCDACVIYPYNWQGKPEGSLEVCVYQPMTFLLRAYNKEESVQKEISVKINGKEEVESIEVSPREPTSAKEKTTFTFGLKNTNYGYLDHGIGRVEGSSDVRLLRDNYSIYRYSILSWSVGGAAVVQERTVKAGRCDALALERLKYILMRDGNSQSYLVSWRIANHCGGDVLVRVLGEPPEGLPEECHDASGHKEFKREGGDICTLSIQCRTQAGEEVNFSSIYPFEMI